MFFKPLQQIFLYKSPKIANFNGRDSTLECPEIEGIFLYFQLDGKDASLLIL
jgi:hypothetical protein